MENGVWTKVRLVLIDFPILELKQDLQTEKIKWGGIYPSEKNQLHTYQKSRN